MRLTSLKAQLIFDELFMLAGRDWAIINAAMELNEDGSPRSLKKIADRIVELRVSKHKEETCG